MLPRHIVTPEVAKTRWCPFARSWTDTRAGPDPNNVGGVNPPGSTDCLCIASECMAWRDATLRYRDSLPWPPRGELVPEHGYCGAAGVG